MRHVPKTIAVAVTLLSLPSCAPGTGTPDGGLGPVDASASDGGQDSSPVEECGDERGAVAGPPMPVVNGSATFDPSVVALTEGQVLAIGAMMLRRADGTWVEASCTGALIASNLALTAAHCIHDRSTGRDRDPATLRFAVGDDVAAPLRVFDVVSAQHHPDYVRLYGSTALHDVGVLVLAEHATIALPEIEPIPVSCAPLDRDSFVGQLVQNVGYGDTSPDMGEPWNTLRLWTVEEVVELTAYDFAVDGHGVSSVCSGDSGGPSLWTMPDGVVRVVGTVSWGDDSCVDIDRFSRTDDNCDFLSELLDACGEIDEAGHCEGDLAVRCDGGSVVAEDCTASGRVCGDVGAGAVGCIEPPDSCAGETPAGRCEGDVAVYCEGGGVLREACADLGELCGLDAEGRSRCVPSDDPCAGLTWEGRCEGDDAVWCEAGALRTRRCADCGQRCGWSDAVSAYYCI